MSLNTLWWSNNIYYDGFISRDLYNLSPLFRLTGWALNCSSPYQGLYSLCNRYTTSTSLVLSTGSRDIFDHLRIYFQTSTGKHHLQIPLPFFWYLPFIFFLFRLIPVFRIESFWVLCSPICRGRVFTFLRTDIIFLPPFPARSLPLINLSYAFYMFP